MTQPTTSALWPTSVRIDGDTYRLTGTPGASHSNPLRLISLYLSGSQGAALTLQEALAQQQ